MVRYFLLSNCLDVFSVEEEDDEEEEEEEVNIDDLDEVEE
jgi:hypothetical protein